MSYKSDGMGDRGTSVTLIFYKVGADWWKEPALNLLAAAAQFSSYTHVEIAIGEGEGLNGMMSNVARIFNDPQGVVSYFTRTTLPFAQARGVRTYPARSCVSSQELCQRTGKNPQVCNATHLPHLLVVPTLASTDRPAMLLCPQYTYLSLGCSKGAEQRMLQFARAQVGKPFSNMGMARSLIWPRSSTMQTFYCAELVAAILKQGGLMYAALHSNSLPMNLFSPG